MKRQLLKAHLSCISFLGAHAAKQLLLHSIFLIHTARSIGFFAYRDGDLIAVVCHGLDLVLEAFEL